MKRIISVAVMVALAAGAAFAAQGEDELARLRREFAEQRKLMEEQHRHMEAMEKRLMELESRDKERAQAETAQAKERSWEDIYDNGFYLRSKDKRFSLVLNGFTQFRYTLSAPEKARTNQTFDVALARLALSGNVFDPDLGYFVQLQGSTLGDNNRITMLDWWMRYRFSQYLSAQAGRLVLPYSRQFYTHPGNLLFSDLSEADYAFNLPRAIGVHASGQAGRLSYHLAGLNSIRALDGGGQQNFGSHLAALGRLELDILNPYGYLETSPTPPAAPQLAVGLAAAFNPIDEASTFQNVVVGDRTTNVTLDAGFRWQALAFQAAGYYRRTHHKASGMSDSDDWGYYAQLGYYLIPQKLEVAGRISGVDFNQANAAGVLGDVTEYTLGLNYYLYGHNVKFQGDYSLLDRDPFTGSNRTDHRFRLQAQLLF